MINPCPDCGAENKDGCKCPDDCESCGAQMQVNLSIKNILIFFSIVATISGNIFIVGKLFADFELLKTNIEDVQANQNVLLLKESILENSYKIKSLRLEMDGDYE